MFWDTQNLTENKIMYILVPRLYFPLPFSTFFFHYECRQKTTKAGEYISSIETIVFSRTFGCCRYLKLRLLSCSPPARS